MEQWFPATDALLCHTKMIMLTFSGCIWPAQDRHDNPHKFDPLHEHEPTKNKTIKAHIENRFESKLKDTYMVIIF